MNVCLISREYPPFFGGGIGAYTVRWSRALAAAGHRAMVITVSDDGRESRDRDGNIAIIRLPFIRGSGHTGDWSGPHPNIASPQSTAAFHTFSPVAAFSMLIALALPRLVDEFEIDVVEAPDTGALAWFALNARRTGAAWPDRTGPAFITCVHSPTQWIAHWNRSPLQGRRDTELAWMERDAAEWSDGLVTPSRAMAEWTSENWGIEPSRIETVPYPLGELEPVAQRSSSSTPPPRPPGSIAFAGRLEPRKGVQVLLEGFALAIADGLDLTLDLAGEDMPAGADRYGQKLIRELPDPARARVRALGRLDGPALAAIRAGSRTVIVPSPMDNFPNTCMEAMAEGRVVIAARAGGMAEMIRDGADGFLFQPEDASDCARALRRAAQLTPAQAADLGRAAASRILDLCGNQRIASRRVEHYQRILTKPRPPRPSLRDFVTIGRGGATPAQIAALRDAASRSGSAFSHGWSLDHSGRARAFSTPREATLQLAPRDIGPLVVARDVARSLPPGLTSWDAAMHLTRAGLPGVVVPTVLVPDARGRIARLFRAFRRV